MGKVLLSMLCLSLLVFTLADISYGWQGRMGGMGDPYGLVQDESDFLIHPAKLAKGEGIKFYGHYRFTYTDVTDWDYDRDTLTLTGALVDLYHYNGSGQEYSHNALLGAATPLGPGRFGIFFTYDGMRGDFDGNEDRLLMSNFAEYDLSSDFDNFALRLLYGLPLGGGFNLGGEVQFAYRQEENETWWQWLVAGPEIYVNQFFGPLNSSINLSPFMFPYNSSYWEPLFKGSLEGEIGAADCEFTLQGGFIFGGDNQLQYEAIVGPGSYAYDLGGAVDGWRIGGDLWVRYPLNDNLSLPMLVRIDYQERTRDGDGMGRLIYSGIDFLYENEEESLEFEVGGGVDKELSAGSRIGAGIYYGYLDQKHNFWVQLAIPGFWQMFDHSDYPAYTEHRVRLSLAGEWEISSAAALRLGANCFYGWVREDFEYTFSSSTLFVVIADSSLNGSHWGIGASVGGSLQFQRFTLEPFVAAGYQELALAGDGHWVPIRGLPAFCHMDLTRCEWYIGGGLSVLFDVP